MPEFELITIQGEASGVNWSVNFITSGIIERQELKEEINQKFESAGQIFSRWRKDSELFHLNEANSTSPLTIDLKLHDLLKHGQWMHRQSLGAFDPTFAPLTNLWGYDPVKETLLTNPSEEEIKTCLSLIGFENLSLLSRGRVKKKNPALQVDMSGSVKGEIIDQICSVLERWGLKNYRVEFGRETRAHGRGRGGKGWIAKLEDEQSSNSGEFERVFLRNYSMATSDTCLSINPFTGTSPKFFKLLDPRTGRGVKHDLIAVHAFAPMARDADAWATALMVLGPEEGMKIAEQMDLVVRFCVREGNQTKKTYSQAFRRLFLE